LGEVFVAVCVNHKDRSGIGICVVCRRIHCADCMTRLDGINHCRLCLRKLARPADTSTGSALGRTVSAGLLGGCAGLILLGLLCLGAGLLAR
jgi:hypothetical protein